MKKKKMIYIFLLIILVGFILTAYNALNGNPISNIIGKKLVVNYLKENYPDEEFRIESGFYDFKFSEYSYDVIRIGEDPYAVIDTSLNDIEKQYQSLNYYVTVKGLFKPRVRYDSIKYARLDEALSQKLSTEASVEVKALLEENLSNLKAVEVNVDVTKFTLDKNTSWSKTLQLDYPIFLHIVTDGTNQSAEDSLIDGEKIQKLLNNNGYYYSNVTINANAFDKALGAKDEYGYVKYSYSFTPDTSLSVKDIDTFK